MDIENHMVIPQPNQYRGPSLDEVNQQIIESCDDALPADAHDLTAEQLSIAADCIINEDSFEDALLALANPATRDKQAHLISDYLRDCVLSVNVFAKGGDYTASLSVAEVKG